MSRLLVTGGAGFIGANFVHYWRARHPGDSITVLDALTSAGNRANLAGANAVGFVEADIRDQGKVDIRTQTGGREHSFSKIARQIGERETL